MRRFSFFLLALLVSSSSYADAPRTFREAKKVAWTIYADRPVDFLDSGIRAEQGLFGFQALPGDPPGQYDQSQRQADAAGQQATPTALVQAFEPDTVLLVEGKGHVASFRERKAGLCCRDIAIL